MLDACVLIALTDATNAFHEPAKAIMATADTFAITALTGAEVMVHPMPGWADLLRDLAIGVVPIEAADMAAIADTRRRSGLKMPDALVLWAASTRQASVATFDQHLAAKAREAGLVVVGYSD